MISVNILEILSSQVENQLAPVTLIFLCFPLNSLDLVLILGAKWDGHWDTFTGCYNSNKLSFKIGFIPFILQDF